ncbi:Ig-like domain-containing protein [Myxococcus sp. K38C18041901]|uniref:Ig-like domain-containing protein n=1 Tax=Myxococcus guangdongensis TaxID=2906760 RepID=UPI0020A6E823|nr:Ig-like domain-containing protein [Myxococcus guangdongensis]MCP3063673.1 Ig-like domain-containing protein [Myxococcus guangdongensis]
MSRNWDRTPGFLPGLRSSILLLSVALAACGGKEDEKPPPPPTANRAPSAQDDLLTTDEDTALVIPGASLVSNDADADGDALTVTAVGKATHGGVTLVGGTVTFTPETDFFGTATFEYTVGDGRLTDTAVATVTVNAVNDAPVAVGDSASTDEDVAVVIPTATLLANDTDVDGDVLLVSGVGAATHGTVTLAGGNVTFTPEANFFGAASFEYTVSDGLLTHTATVAVTVNSVEDAPVAVADTVYARRNTPRYIKQDELTANDHMGDGFLFRLAGVGSAVHCTVEIDGGEIDFTPEADFTGSATFQYTVRNGAGTTSATVTIIVGEAPQAVDDTVSTDEDTVLVIPVATLVANDIDVDTDDLLVEGAFSDTHGSVTLDGQNVTFTPEANFFGTATFQYRVTDRASFSTATVRVTVNPVNDAPVAVADSVLASVDVAQRIPAATLLFNDGDVEGDALALTGVSNARNGTVELVGDAVRFTPASGFVGAARFDYQVADTHGATGTGSVDVRVRGYAVRSIFAGAGTTCAVFTDGRLKCWGKNGMGQLGLEHADDRGDGRASNLMSNLPFVRVGTDVRVAMMGLGDGFSCALLEGGAVKCWGDSEQGQLGLGDTQRRGDGPGEMGDALPRVDLGTGRTAKTLVSGLKHLCAILDDGAVKCWGDNWDGRLGLGDTQPRGDGPGEMGNALPAVNLGTGRTAKALAAGGRHTCALLDDDSVKCWGENAWGQLGLGDKVVRGDGPGEMGDALPRVNLGTGRTAKAIAAREHSTCALLDDGSIKCWGGNPYGALGLGDKVHRGDDAGEMGDGLPRVDLGTGRTAKTLTVGSIYACALLDDGSVKCWGGGYAGQLGLGDWNNRGGEPGEMGDALPRVNLGAGRAVTSLAAGAHHTCATFDEGSVKCWGANHSGQLGLNHSDHRGDNPGEMGEALPPIEL